MLKKVFRKQSDIARNAHWYTEETILQELQKPGLTSDERECLAGKLRIARENSRKWEEKNEEAAVKQGETIGILKGSCIVACGFMTGALLVILKKLI